MIYSFKGDYTVFFFSDSPDIQYLTGTDIDRMQRSNALFLLKLKEKRRISQVAIDDVVAGSRNLISQTITHVQAGVKDKLAEAGIDPESIKGLNNIFESVDPFENLGTSYLQEHEELGLVVSANIHVHT